MKEKSGYLIILIFILSLTASGSALEEAPLQGNDGISNILLVYDSASEDGVTNDEISLVLQLYSCREEGINYMQDCLDNNPNIISPNSIMDTTELLGVENSDEPKEDPNDDPYIEFTDAEVTSEIVSADGEGLNVDFSFERKTSTRNEVSPKVGLHIDESSSPVKAFEVTDRDEEDDPQTVSANWQTIWDEVGESNTDASAQLVLEEGSSQGYSWGEDSIDAGEFTIERCGNFDSEFQDGWEQEIEYNSVDSCLDKVSVTRSEDGNDDLHDFTIRSNSKGLNGEVKIEKTFDKPQGTERLTINIEKIQDLSTADGRYSDIEIRHFEGGPDGSGWNTLLEGQVGSLEPTTVSADFTKSINSDNTHPYNLIQIIVSNDYYSADRPVEIKGSLVFEQYPEDGPGTCQPGQTWCRNAGDCIDDDAYELSRCVG